MTYNLLAYFIYTVIIFYVTAIVGKKFHQNGIHYIELFTPDHATGVAINNILLILYYCLNIGFAIYIIQFWEPLNNHIELINSIGTHIGLIIISLALMHYWNLLWIYLFFRWKQFAKTSKII
ncbi:MAG: hypothetical protein H6600_03245 [Flavobacteriales bacterium]|nr:hypothetical protein [Flavobacteriales bacterium]MCB9197447.1 hypothetical protein [Flavobacteriales bacterium]